MKKVLVANRGEIARRVLRTLKKMDIKSVAIYSDADANAPHVLEADEAVYVGKSPSAESYLQQDKIIQICLDLGVDAVHPGYGFLSENEDFAQACADAGLVFIGPPASAIRDMGSKAAAKALLAKACAGARLELVSAYALPLPQQVLMSVLGGARHWLGPVIGAIAITGLLYAFTGKIGRASCRERVSSPV